MNDDKSKVMRQIRESLKTAHLPAARATLSPLPQAGQGDREKMIESFRRELEPLGGTSYRAHNDEEAIEIVLQILRQADTQELITWTDEEIAVRGLGEALKLNRYTRMCVDVPTDGEGRRKKLDELGRAGAGITGAMAGLADTGSLALTSSASRPRLASLLPPIHIAVLRTSKLFPSMASFFAANPEITRDASNLVFVTGPSRTADIELTLQRGVHGPKFVHVVLVD